MLQVCNIVCFDPRASLSARESTYTKKRSKPTFVAPLQVWRKQKFATDNFLSRKSSEGAAQVAIVLSRQSTNSTAAVASIHYLFKVWSYQWFSTLLGKNTNRSILRSPFRDKKISTRNNQRWVEILHYIRGAHRSVRVFACIVYKREKRSWAVRESRDRLKKWILLVAAGRRRRWGVDFMSHWLGPMNNASTAFCVRPNVRFIHGELSLGICVRRLMRFAIHVSPGAKRWIEYRLIMPLFEQHPHEFGKKQTILIWHAF